MARAIVVPVVAILAFATCVGARSADESPSAPPFLSLTVAVVDQSVTGETAVIVWGPHENGTDHVIMLPADRATPGELRTAAVALFALVKSGSVFEPGTWLRAQPGSGPIGEHASLQWTQRVTKDLESAERRPLAGVGDVPFALATVQVP